MEGFHGPKSYGKRRKESWGTEVFPSLRVANIDSASHGSSGLGALAPEGFDRLGWGLRHLARLARTMVLPEGRGKGESGGERTFSTVLPLPEGALQAPAGTFQTASPAVERRGGNGLRLIA